MPIRVASWGGAATSESDENDEKIIMLALGSDDNENAFQQDIGMGEAMIFDVGDPTARGRVVGKLRAIFRKFEAQKRYRLVGDTVRWKDSPNAGEMILEFQYMNLESDEEKPFSRTFRSGV